MLPYSSGGSRIYQGSNTQRNVSTQQQHQQQEQRQEMLQQMRYADFDNLF